MANQTTSTALTKRKSEDMLLMPPPPPPKKIKRPSTVLDEDVYTSALSHIIARDFFPGLLESQAQAEYLSALDSKDSDWIREAGRRLTQVMTPGPDGKRGRRGTSMATPMRGTPSATPRGKYTGDTPSRSISATPDRSADFRPEGPEVDTSLSLSAFQAKYTSEDNESFNGLLDAQNAARAKKYAFLQASQVANSKRLPASTTQKRLSFKQGQALIPRPSQDLDSRPASYDGFKPRQGARNTLMFAPDSVEDTHTTLAQAAQDASAAPPKRTNYTGTRLPLAPAAPPPPSPSMSAIDAAISGHPRPSSTDAGYTGAETPRVNGYKFVDAEPLPHELTVGVPVSDAEADAYEHEAAMALMPKLDSQNMKGGFKLQNQSRREGVHERLVEKIDSKRRTNKGGVDLLKQIGRTETPRFASSPAITRKEAMTPAARMLASRLTSSTPGRGGEVFGSAAKDKSVPRKGLEGVTPVRKKK